jgi:hypothetical protein
LSATVTMPDYLSANACSRSFVIIRKNQINLSHYAANSGAKSWIYRFMLRGKAREMGLGSISAISLLDARTKAAECRKLRHEGIDPIKARRGQTQPANARRCQGNHIWAAADAYIASQRAGWRNAKHGAQWKSTLVCTCRKRRRPTTADHHQISPQQSCRRHVTGGQLQHSIVHGGCGLKIPG